MFAQRADLLARANSRRLFQLAVPADRDMPGDDALRDALGGGDLSDYGPEVQETLTLALAAIDGALADADALIVSYGIPAVAQAPLLARLASTVALYYLQGAERVTDELRRAYDGVIDTLKAHARGDVMLVPAAPEDQEPSSDLAMIESTPRRYRAAWPSEDGL